MNSKTTIKKVGPYNHWKCRDFTWDLKNPQIAKWFGFVYCITEKSTGIRYIGKKQFHTYKRKKQHRESNWAVYAGSSRHLLYNEDNTYEILSLHETRGSLTYGEMWVQMNLDVLRKPDKFYNRAIAGCRFKVKPPTAREIKHSTDFVEYFLTK